LEPGTRPSRAAHYSGWEASQAAIQAALEQHAPIDGLLGFSQGATATALFLAHAQRAADEQQPQQQHQQQPRPQPRRLGDLRFAVVVAGFLPRDDSHAAVLQRHPPPQGLPCLHVHGAGDALVPEERSRALWECFHPGSVRVFKHPGAHMVSGRGGRPALLQCLGRCS
jgi:predicted esterase